MSLKLAGKVIHEKIHVVGTLHSNGREDPQQELLKNVKQGEIILTENTKGVIILKLKDKRGILLPCTKH